MRLAPSSSPYSLPPTLGPLPPSALRLVSSLTASEISDTSGVSEVIQPPAPHSLMRSLSRRLGFWTPGCRTGQFGGRWSEWDPQCPGRVRVPWHVDAPGYCQCSGQCQGHIVSCAAFMLPCIFNDSGFYAIYLC